MADQVFTGSPLVPGAGVEEQVRQLMREVEGLRHEVRELQASVGTVTYVAPERPRQGMLRFADGTHWDPGFGAGYYAYVDGGWSPDL